jgi:hypothetical protein
MGVISMRFNQEEEKMLKKLAGYFHADKSALIKKSLIELHENMVDMEATAFPSGLKCLPA